LANGLFEARPGQPASSGPKRRYEPVPIVAIFPIGIGAQGAGVLAGVISPMEEQSLIDRIAELQLKPFQFGAYEGKRRVVSFGRAYDFRQWPGRCIFLP
jgi:hypothetical protein